MAVSGGRIRAVSKISESSELVNKALFSQRSADILLIKRLNFS